MKKLAPLLIFLLSACGSAPATAPKAETISCTAAYRASVTEGIEREETITFADVDSEQSIPFTTLVFHAAYRAGEMDNERNLRIWVTDAGQTAVYHTTLYQLPIDSGHKISLWGDMVSLGLTTATSLVPMQSCSIGAKLRKLHHVSTDQLSCHYKENDVMHIIKAIKNAPVFVKILSALIMSLVVVYLTIVLSIWPNDYFWTSGHDCSR